MQLLIYSVYLDEVLRNAPRLLFVCLFAFSHKSVYFLLSRRVHVSYIEISFLVAADNEVGLELRTGRRERNFNETKLF